MSIVLAAIMAAALALPIANTHPGALDKDDASATGIDKSSLASESKVASLEAQLNEIEFMTAMQTGMSDSSGIEMSKAGATANGSDYQLNSTVITTASEQNCLGFLGQHVCYGTTYQFPEPKTFGNLGLVTVYESRTKLTKGPLINFELTNAAKSKPPGYTASFKGGVKLNVPTGQIAVPVLAASGQIDSAGPTVVRASTPESWKPMEAILPEFVMSTIDGTVTIRQDNSLKCEVAAAPLTVSASGGSIKLIEWIGNIGFDTASQTSIVSVGGKLMLGASNGLEASITAVMNTAEPSAEGVIKHTGGWSPFSGSLKQTLATPAFNGAFKIGVAGKLWSVHSTTAWAQPLDLLPFRATRGKLMMQGATPSTGPGLEINFLQATASSSVTYAGTVTAKLLIGGDAPLPPLDLSGEVFPSSHATLTLTKIKTATNLANEAVNRWTPLPRLTKKLQFPDFRGTLKLDASKVDCDVASQPTSVSLANGNLRLVDWVGRMRVDSEHLKLQASATGSVRIGGPKGLEAAIAADLNLSPSTQGAAVVLKHPGGWSAFTGSIGRKFQTPSFEATLALGGGGSNDFIRLDSSASWSSSITLLDNNYITIKGVGSEAGPSVALKLTQKTKSAAVDYTLSIQGTILLGGTAPVNGQTFPPLTLKGPLYSTDEKCTLSISNLLDASYKPLKGLVDDFRMSGMAGQMIFNGGSVNSYVTASPVSVTLAGGYLELLNWEGRAEVNTQSVSIAASATGSVRLGGTKGIEANIRATIDTALPKAQVTITHSGGWKPFPALTPQNKPNPLASYFQTPPFTGALTIGGGALITLDASAKYEKPIILIAGGIAALVDKTDNNKGPGLTLTMRQSSLNTDPTYEVIVDGRLTWNLPTSFSFPDLPFTGALFDAQKALRGVLDTAATQFAAGRQTANGQAAGSQAKWSPLGPLLSKLEAVGVNGDIKLTPEGAVEVLMGANAPIAASSLADGMLAITNFAPTLKADSNGKVTVEGTGAGKIGGSSGVEGTLGMMMEFPKLTLSSAIKSSVLMSAQTNTTLAATAATAPASAVITFQHAGGWKPFGDIVNYKTPAFNGQITLGGASTKSQHTLESLVSNVAADDAQMLDPTQLNFEHTIATPKPVVLGNGLVTITGKTADVGPDFVVSLKQNPGSGVSYRAYFESTVCLPLSNPSSCFVMKASGKTTGSTAVMELDAPMVLVTPPSGGAIPTETKPLASVSGLPQVLRDALVIPSSKTNLIKLTVDTAESALRFDIGAMLQIDIPETGRLRKISLRVQGKGYGTFKDDEMKGGFIASLPPGYSPFTYAENSAAFKRLKQFTGMPLSLSAVEALPLAVFGDAVMKDVSKGISFHYKGTSPFPEFCSRMEATFNAASLTEIQMAATCPTSSKYTFQSVPSLNFIQMNQISVSAKLSSATLAFQLGTKIQIATGTSTCSAPATDAACLTADISAGIGFSLTSMTAGISSTLDGVWFDPLGLRNFAIANPRLAIDLKLTPSITYLSKVSWGASLYWKRPTLSSWPSTLADKTAETVTGSQILTLSSALAYQISHTDSALNALRLPIFGVKLTLTQMTLTDILGMGADVSASLIYALNGAIPTIDRIALPSVALPPALSSAATHFREALDFEFTGNYYMSLTNSNDDFKTRGVKIDCDSKARAIRGIAFDLSVLVELTACLPGDTCSSTTASELAALTTREPTAVLDLRDANRTVAAASSLTPLRFAQLIKSGITDPKIKFKAKGTLPVVGSLTFVGELTKSSFLLSVSRSMDFFGIISTNYIFSIGLNAGKFALSFKSEDKIFGFSSVATGTIQNERTPYVQAALRVDVGDKPLSLFQDSEVDCATCASYVYDDCSASSGCIWDRTATTQKQCSDITNVYSCWKHAPLGCNWKGNYWTSSGTCTGTYTSLKPVCKHWGCTGAAEAGAAKAVKLRRNLGSFVVSMSASFESGGVASVTSTLVWKPPTVLQSTFSLQNEYKRTKAVSANMDGLEATFPLPAPVGDVCLRFANGQVTRCTTTHVASLNISTL